jgi:hypothetical protein
MRVILAAFRPEIGSGIRGEGPSSEAVLRGTCSHWPTAPERRVRQRRPPGAALDFRTDLARGRASRLRLGTRHQALTRAPHRPFAERGAVQPEPRRGMRRRGPGRLSWSRASWRSAAPGGSWHFAPFRWQPGQPPVILSVLVRTGRRPLTDSHTMPRAQHPSSAPFRQRPRPRSPLALGTFPASSST